MKSLLLLLIVFFCIRFNVSSQTLLQSSFEQYNNGDLLGLVDPQNWTTWSNQPGSGEDAAITSEHAASGTKSVKVSTGTDAVFKIADYTSGYYRINFKIYIPAGYYGYYCLLQDFNGAYSEFGMQVFFDTGGQGSIDGGAQTAATFTYQYDTWLSIENVIDLDNDWAEFYLQGNLVHGWIWSKGIFGTGNLKQLGGMNMYGWGENGPPLYYFDDLEFKAGFEFETNLKAILEGPYNGSIMDSSLNVGGLLPLQQPFNNPPWDYFGTEQVSNIPNNNIVDWILVELRETAGDASTAYKDNAVAAQAGFILKDGSIVTTDGQSPMVFNHIVTQKLFAVIYHRNHLAVMSAAELVYVGGSYSYDFTVGASQAFGGSLAQKELSWSVWGIIAGDGNADGQVDNSDKNDVWKPQSGSSGYKSGDFTMNGQVDNIDKNDYWQNNSGRSSQVPGLWTCGKPIADERDGQIYNTVQIGTQCWMAENLNIGVFVNGNTSQSNNGIIEKYCFNNNSGICNVHGGLYQWNEMMQYSITQGAQGVCPDGWYIPANNEWTAMINYLGDNNGGKLKEIGYVHWIPPNTGATNESGFTAFGSGYRYGAGNYDQLHSNCYFWSSTQFESQAWARKLSYDMASVGNYLFNYDYGYSVRCLKIPTNQPPQLSNPSPPDNASNQQLNIQISWTCIDPENDPLTYDIFFGNTSPPPQVSTGQSATSYNPGQLQYQTSYYWQVIAYDNHSHTTIGPVWSFSTMPQPVWQCGDSFVDIRDNQTYNTVQIGYQCWIAENLNFGNMIQSSNNQTDNGIIEKYCYGNDIANCDIYGGLYQWSEMMQYSVISGVKGICFDNWHIPSDSEWCDLEQFVDTNITCGSTGLRGIDGGGKLKETGSIHWNSPNTGATNSSGFTALPGGYRYYNSGSFYSLNIIGSFWSSSGGASKAWFRALYNISAQVSRYYDYSHFGFSVRCIKD